MARRLTREEGILAGGSCGTAMVAAREVVRDLIADGRRERGGRRRAPARQRPELPLQALQRRVDARQRPDGTTGAATRIADAAGRPPPRTGSAAGRRRPDDRAGRRRHRQLQTYGISQLPVSEEAEGDAVVGLVGSISEKSLLDRAYRDPTVVERTVGEVMDPPLPLVEASATLDEAFALLSGGATALVAVRGERPAGRGHQARPARVPRPPSRLGGLAVYATPVLSAIRFGSSSAR